MDALLENLRILRKFHLWETMFHTTTKRVPVVLKMKATQVISRYYMHLRGLYRSTTVFIMSILILMLCQAMLRGLDEQRFDATDANKPRSVAGGHGRFCQSPALGRLHRIAISIP